MVGLGRNYPNYLCELVDRVSERLVRLELIRSSFKRSLGSSGHKFAVLLARPLQMITDQKTDRVLLPAVKRAASVVLYALLLCVLIALSVWYFVLNNVAVYRGISLAPGTTITQNFLLNYGGFYRMGIVAERKFPHHQLQCLLGINDAYGVKNCNETRLRYSWSLSCNGGRINYSGTSEKILGGAYANDWMETEFGGFEAKHWQRCQLKINIIEVSPLLSATNPKLRIFTELF